MMRLVCIFIFCIMWCLSACAQAPCSFTASVNSTTVALGDTIFLSLDFIGEEEPSAPKLPPIPDVEVTPQPPTTQRQTSIELINGRLRRVESVAISFRYALTPKKLGTFTIPSVTLKSKGKEFSSQPITIQVVDAVPQDHVLVEMTANKTELYVDEQVVLTVRFAFDDVRRIVADEYFYCSIPWLLNLEGFIVEPAADFLKSLKGDGVLVVNGEHKVPFEVRRIKYPAHGDREYVVYSLSKPLFPTSQGEHRIPTCTFKCQYAQSLRRTEDFFFGAQFIPQNVQNIFARSNELTLKVKPLPETGRPADFTGAVGEYQMRVTVEPRSVRAHDPITVTTRISGAGNIQAITPPRLINTTGFKCYAGDVKTTFSKEGGKIVGEKTFTTILEPQSPEVKAVPAVTFSYFNPKIGRYETLKEGPFPVTVHPPEERPPVATTIPSAPTITKGVAVELTKDIMPIATDLAGLTDQRLPDYMGRLMLCVLPAPWLMAGIAYLIRRRRERLRLDPGYARASRALRAARQKLASAKVSANSVPIRQFCDIIARAVREYIADKLNLPPASVSTDSVKDLLSARGVEAQTVDSVAAFLAECDRVRFSFDGEQAVAYSDLLAKAQWILKRLEDVL